MFNPFTKQFDYYIGPGDCLTCKAPLTINDSSGNFIFKVDATGGVFQSSMKSGINQGSYGAAAGELWIDTSAGNVIKVGV